jgi:hypothetical protein
MVIKICRVLDSTSQEKEAYEAVQPVVAWAKEYEQRQQKQKVASERDEEWMMGLQNQFPIAA